MTNPIDRRYQALKRHRPCNPSLSKPVKMSRLKMLGVVLGTASLSHLISFHPFRQYMSDTHREGRHLPIVNDLSAINESRQEESWGEKNRERRKRTQPPNAHRLIEIQYEILLQSQNLTVAPEQTIVERYDHSVCGQHARAAAKHFPHGYPHQVNLDSKSRVLITNILSSAGMHLALKISSECGVNAILGIDSMLPNTRRNRVDLLERYAMLKRRIPSLKKLATPYLGILPERDAERLHSFRATHVVHLVPDYLQDQENELYPLRDKMRSMEQVLDFIRQTDAKPHLLYAGPNLLFEHVLAAFYHAHFNINSVGLDLPRLYGPWGHIGSWTWNAAERVVNRSSKPKNQTASSEDYSTYLYVEDAVDAILAASQYTNGIVMLHVTSSTTGRALVKALTRKTEVEKAETTDLDHKRHWQSEIQWAPETHASAGAQQLLSWHFAKAHPYGRGDYGRKLPTNIKYNFHYQFPCASECSIPGSCIPTTFDAVAPTSRKLTKGCKNVLYMVNLSNGVLTLPQAIALSSNATAGFCQLAFVSRSSSVGKQKDVYHGWTLLPIAVDDSKMTESLYSLLKLSPSLFFDSNVIKAIFVDLETFLLPDAAGMIAFTRSIDAHGRNGKHIRIQRPGTPIVRWEWHGGKAARLTMLLAHEDPELVLLANESFTSRVQMIANRHGNRSSSRSSNQIKFYEHASHLVLTTESRRMDELRPPYYKGFPFHFLRSNMVVHDLRVDQARLLRCEWYDEQVFWGVRHFDDVSLAFVLAKRRVQGRHGPDDEDGGWTPLLVPATDEMEVGVPVTSLGGTELFLRVLSHPSNTQVQAEERIIEDYKEKQEAQGDDEMKEEDKL